MPNGRCRLHGGKSLAGIASPQFKTGRYSKYMPQRLLERYEQSVDDPELLNMRADISLVDSRLADLLKRADTGEAGKLWAQARRANDDLQKAMDNENYGSMATACRELDRVIGDGLTDYETWTEIAALLDQRRKLVEAEQKRLVAMQQMISAEQAMVLVTALIETVKRHVPDRATRTAIATDIRGLVTANNGGQT